MPNYAPPVWTNESPRGSCQEFGTKTHAVTTGMIRVVKIGGGIIDSEQQLDAVLDSIARSADPVILVHGGGRLATDLATRIGIDQTMIDGRRVTDIDTLRVVTMTYAG